MWSQGLFEILFFLQQVQKLILNFIMQSLQHRNFPRLNIWTFCGLKLLTKVLPRFDLKNDEKSSKINYQ